jgi:PTH1 family peptidyl-tRNA hydrolase
MKVIAGLGNPGARYAGTRHNLGFDVLDRLADRLAAPEWREKHKGLIAEARFKSERVLLVKPLTYMNLSGECVAPAARNKAHSPDEILAVVDDINLPLGRLRLRGGGSAGGHNGLKSLIERLGSRDFHRMRMGVGDSRATGDLSHHVLARFRPDEKQAVQEMIEEACDAALVWLTDGIDTAMNRYNTGGPRA